MNKTHPLDNNYMDNFIEKLEKLKQDKSPEKYYLDKIQNLENDVINLQKKIDEILLIIKYKNMGIQNTVHEILNDIKSFDNS